MRLDLDRLRRECRRQGTDVESVADAAEISRDLVLAQSSAQTTDSPKYVEGLARVLGVEPFDIAMDD